MNTCGLCEQQLEHRYLCSSCARATTERLIRMPQLWTALAEFLAPSSSTGPQYGRTRLAEAPLPVREHVLSLRAAGGIVEVLERWYIAMRADRGWARPVKLRASDVGMAGRVAAAARALAANAEWIAEYWPRAGEFAAEIRDLEGNVLSIVDPEDREERRRKRGTRIGQCVAQLVEDGQDDAEPDVCGAVLRSYPGQATVTCEWCGTSYGPEDYLMLRHYQPVKSA